MFIEKLTCCYGRFLSLAHGLYIVSMVHPLWIEGEYFHCSFTRVSGPPEWTSLIHKGAVGLLHKGQWASFIRVSGPLSQERVGHLHKREWATFTRESGPPSQERVHGPPSQERVHEPPSQGLVHGASTLLQKSMSNDMKLQMQRVSLFICM